MLQVNNETLFKPNLIEAALDSEYAERTEQHGSLTKWLHWIMAFIILYATVAGYGMLLVMDHPWMFNVLSNLNMSFATVGSVLFLIRWIWRYFRTEPDLKATISDKQKRCAKLAHAAMYFVMFIVFVSGFLMLKHGYQFFWLFEIPNPIDNVAVNEFFFVVHRASCMALATLIVVHILAALKHHFILKNNILRSMTFRLNK